MSCQKAYRVILVTELRRLGHKVEEEKVCGFSYNGQEYQNMLNSDLIRSRIFTIRGVQVMLAPDLAELYQVETRIFNQAVKRNIKRFPENFRFQLTKDELNEVITNCDNPDKLRFAPVVPYAFTEQGIAMPSAQAHLLMGCEPPQGYPPTSCSEESP